MPPLLCAGGAPLCVDAASGAAVAHQQDSPRTAFARTQKSLYPVQRHTNHARATNYQRTVVINAREYREIAAILRCRRPAHPRPGCGNMLVHLRPHHGCSAHRCRMAGGGNHLCHKLVFPPPHVAFCRQRSIPVHQGGGDLCVEAAHYKQHSANLLATPWVVQSC